MQDSYHLEYICTDTEHLWDGLDTMAARMGITENVHYLGVRKNPYKYMRMAKVLVSCSFSEGLPGVLIESLFLNTPVISTNSSEGVWEILNCVEKYNPRLKGVKGSNYLEALAGTRTVVFDKTGTITQGVFEVCGIHGTNCASGSCPVESGHPVYTKEEEQLLEYAALAECHSTHPISVSLQKAYGKKLDVDRVTDVQEIGGHGVIATVDGHRVAAGNDKLMKKEKIAYRNCSCTQF